MAEGQQEPNGAESTLNNNGDKRAWLKIKWESLGIGLPGVWLAFLYVFLGMFVVFSLSAHQLQYQIYSLNADRERDQQISVWQILQTHAQWKAISLEIDSQTVRLQKLSSDRIQAGDDLQKADTENLRANISCSGKLAVFQQNLPLLGEALNCNRSDEAAISSAVGFMDDGAEKQKLTTQLKELSESIDAVEASIMELTIKDQKRHAIDGQYQALNEAYNVNIAKRETLLNDDQNLGTKAGDFLNALDYMGGKEALWFIPSFTSMPSDTLKLILVLSMGALGGTISLTRSYLAQKKSLAEDRIGGAYYTFRPFLGAITALSIFILAKAGVLIISTPDQGAGGAELSPYFLSFIGIISGMLADSALDTIQRTGNNWFKNSEVSRDLWAYGLGKALAGDPNAKKEQRDKNLEDNMALLSETLDVSVPTIMKWVDEKQKVPASMQALISAFVRIPPRELFSDVGGDLNVTKMWFAEEWKKNSEST